MSVTGTLLLGGFVLSAALMVARILPALLALPLMAAWIAWCAGLPFLTWANEVMLGGALRLSSAIALVVFGSMFAKVIQKTGISDAIIKKAAEMAGDRPIAIAFLMLAATAFVFTGMSGLGAVLMVGSIVLPIMTSTGISPLDAASILLLGINPLRIAYDPAQPDHQSAGRSFCGRHSGCGRGSVPVYRHRHAGDGHSPSAGCSSIESCPDLYTS